MKLHLSYDGIATACKKTVNDLDYTNDVLLCTCKNCIDNSDINKSIPIAMEKRKLMGMLINCIDKDGNVDHEPVLTKNEQTMQRLIDNLPKDLSYQIQQCWYDLIIYNGYKYTIEDGIFKHVPFINTEKDEKQ